MRSSHMMTFSNLITSPSIPLPPVHRTTGDGEESGVSDLENYWSGNELYIELIVIKS